MIALPPFARVARDLPAGRHPFERLLPGVAQSPAMRRIVNASVSAQRLLAGAAVLIEPGEGYVWIDDDDPCIVLMEPYYRGGRALDLYLDLLHELTHLRQLREGYDLWDKRYAYVDRITEVEGYAVAVEEGRRLGMTTAMIRDHLSNPWMTREDVARLLSHIDRLLRGEHLDLPLAEED